MLKAKQDKEWRRFKSKQRNQKYMHEKLEEEYQQKVLMPELERKKLELKEKRDFFKPIDRKEIDEFQKKYEENFKKKLEEKRREREKWYNDIGQGDYDPNRYKTKVYDKVMQEEKGTEESKFNQIQEKKRKAEKMNNYARIVKEMHWPQVSSKKKEEVQRIKQLLDQKNKRRSAPNKNRSVDPYRSGAASDSDTRSMIKRPDWNKFHNPLVPRPMPKKEPIVKDYLREIRVKRQEDDSGRKNTTQHMNWDSIKDQNLDDKTKIELLKARTKLIEENAQRKEEMNKVHGSSVEENVDINDMLIDAIEMKLSILDQIE